MALLSAQAAGLPGVTRYSLDFRFDLKNERVNCNAIMTVRNVSDSSYRVLPFLLYRLFVVEQVRVRDGDTLEYTQGIVAMGDEPTLQATLATVRLRTPLAPQESTTVEIVYSGSMFGYPEVMAYVRDRVDEQYSLLRPDAFAYPLLALPTMASARIAMETKFTYEVAATVPQGFRAACGGELMSSSASGGNVKFLFRSKVPTWRIDVAVARFAFVEDTSAHVTLYALPEDSVEGARNVLRASRDAIGFYSGLFGRPEQFKGYSIIEIPDGWGSQASDYYFLQSAAAFRDNSRVHEVYHEIGHSWNAVCTRDVQRCRYFDEAFAAYYEALATRAFRGRTAFSEAMERSRSSFVAWAKKVREVYDTPISAYGEKELGRHSYTKGAWSLYILSQLVGEETFASIVRTMISETKVHPIDFEGFQSVCERVSGRKLGAFFKEWIFGSESSRLLAENTPLQAILERYKQ